MKKKQIISIGTAAALFITTAILKPEHVLAAPACENVPECGVNGIIVGSQIIGGILYYLVKSGAGAVHKVRSKKSSPPAHRNTQGGEGHQIGSEVDGGLVSSEEECKRKALVYGERYGGVWTPKTKPANISSPESVWGSRRQLKCTLVRVE